VNRVFPALLWLAAGVALTFLLLPLVALVTRVGPAELLDALGSEVARDALVVTLETTLVAQALILLVGTPAAYLIATRRFRGRSVVVTLVELPLVLPPAVAGIGLLAAFGRLGLLGSTFEALGVSVAFTKVAVVLAVAFVAGPFYLRPRSPPSRASTPISGTLPGRSAPGPGRRSGVSRCRSRAGGSQPAPRSRSRGGSGSSGPRSCSPAASRASPRRSRSRSTSSSTSTSTRRSRSASSS
jgi:molybdate transport system permease protein